MSVNLYQHNFIQFKNNVALLLQQLESALRASVSTGSHAGKQASVVDQFGAVEAKKVTGRFEPKQRTDGQVDRRWVSPVGYDLLQQIDHADKLRNLSDPKNSYTQNTVAAFNRSMDDEILAGALGDNLVGEMGTTVRVFDTNQVVAVGVGSASATTGMNVTKLKAAKKLFRKAQVNLDSEMLYCVISAEQEEDLLNEIQITSLDFNTRPVLVDGQIKQFLGFMFIHSERLPVDGSGYRRCIAYIKSGLYLGIWEERIDNVYQDTNLKGDPWSIYSMGTYGATRIEEKRIVEIKCAE